MHETLQHETSIHSEITHDEQRSFSEIVAYYDVNIDAGLVEDADAFQAINETLQNLNIDLQADKIAELRQTRDELLGEFMLNPHDSYMAEVMNYARLCEDRCMRWQDESGARITEFVTADPERKKADLHFRIVEFASGNVKVSTEVPLRGRDYGEDAEPYFIHADTAGSFSIEQKIWKRGTYKYLDLALDSDEANERLEQFFLYSTEAIHLAYTRDVEAQQAANQLAKTFLVDKNVVRYSEIAV